MTIRHEHIFENRLALLWGTKFISPQLSIYLWGESQYRGDLFNIILTNSVCDINLWRVPNEVAFDNTQIICKGYSVSDAVPTKIGGII